MESANEILEKMAVDTTKTADWIPADVYSKVIIQAAKEGRKLAGIIAAVKENLKAGQGDTIQVRYVPRRTAQGPIAEGAALTSTDTTVGTYSITVQKYGDYVELSDESIYYTSGDIRGQILQAMADGWALKLDELVYNAIATATPGSTVTLSTAGDESELYGAIVELKAQMEAKHIPADDLILIIHPTVEAILAKETSLGVRGQMVKFDNNGNLQSVAGVKTIVTSVANEWSSDLNAVLAVMIAKSRAVGEVWGKPLKFWEWYDGTTNMYKDGYWAYYGVAAMDTDGIGHIINPAQ